MSEPESIQDIAQTLSPKQEYMDAPNGGKLKVGNWGHDGSNAGAPKSRVRKQAGQNAERFAVAIAKELDRHESGEKPLPVAQLIKGQESSAKTAYGDQVEVTLDSETILSEVAESIGQFFTEQGLEPELALALYESISQRLRDR